MKKWILILGCLLLSVVLTACSMGGTNNTSSGGMVSNLKSDVMSETSKIQSDVKDKASNGVIHDDHAQNGQVDDSAPQSYSSSLGSATESTNNVTSDL